MTIVGFESPFSQLLKPNYRWVIFSQKFLWICWLPEKAIQAILKMPF
jgi:hypothetical protein